MVTRIIKVPAMIENRIVLDGIQEPPSSLETRLSILTYKVGNMHENLVKGKRIDSEVHRLEFQYNLAQVMCHCIIIAMTEGYDVSKLVDMGWEYIGERFKDFRDNFDWRGDEK